MADVEQAMKAAIQNGSYQFAQSAAFKGDAALLACSQTNPAHIGRFTAGSKAAAVGKIQTALAAIFAALGMATPPGAQDAAGNYGNSTAAAVLALKKRIGLVNYAGQYDDIVGIKTIHALDAALMALSGGGGGTVTVLRTLDFYIEIQGTLGPDEGTKRVLDQLNNFSALAPIAADADYLTRHELQTINFWGSPFAQKSPVDAIVAEVTRISGERMLPPGRTVIMGISNGGPNAIDLALKLQATRAISYLGLIDAAFEGPRDAHLRVPVSAGRIESYFEALTNDWTDVMPGLEWHGTAPGWGGGSLDQSLGNERTLAETAVALARTAAKGRAGLGYRIAEPAFARYHLKAAVMGAGRARPNFLSVLRAP